MVARLKPRATVAEAQSQIDAQNATLEVDWRSLAFSLGYLVFLAGVPLWMAAHFRFPRGSRSHSTQWPRSASSFYLARKIADHQPIGDACRHAISAPPSPWWWSRRSCSPGRDICVAGSTSSAAVPLRDANVRETAWPPARVRLVYVQDSIVDLDPLRAEPRSYDACRVAGQTFSAPWYENIERLACIADRRPGAMGRHTDAYLLARSRSRYVLEPWIQRKVRNRRSGSRSWDAARSPGQFAPNCTAW